MPANTLKSLAKKEAKKEGDEDSNKYRKAYKIAIKHFEDVWNKAKDAVNYEKTNPAYWPTVQKVFISMVKKLKS